MCHNTLPTLHAQAGLLCRHPFTADIAKENVPVQHWGTPAFWRMNYLLTGIWAGIFFIMTLSYLVRCTLYMLCTRGGSCMHACSRSTWHAL